MHGAKLSACPETGELAGLIGVGTASRSENPGTGEESSTLAAAPASTHRILEVPVGGICEHALREALGVTTAEFNSLLGDELGAPRDYRPAPRGCIFNLQGARRAAQLLRIDVEILGPGEQPAASFQGNGSRRERAPWYLRDQSED